MVALCTVMKLGVAGLIGNASAAEAAAVRAAGFSAASWHVPSLELLNDEAALRSIRRSMDGSGLELCQLLPPQYPSLVHPSADTRAAGVAALEVCVRAAAILGAGNVYVRPGSLNPAGPWTPHPDNHADETCARLVESLRSLAPAAAAAGVLVALEGHVVSPLHTADRVMDVIHRVGSPVLRFNMDPVNFISNLEEAYHTAPVIDALCDRLGGVTVCAHAKDVNVANRLVVHIDECVPGTGFLDLPLFLRRFHDCCPDGVVVIEHLRPDQVPQAREALFDAAAEAGILFEQ